MPDSQGPPGAAIVVELSPRDYRLRGLAFIGLGAVLLIVCVIVYSVSADRKILNPVVAIGTLAYGIYCRRRAARQETRLLLRIDGSGIRTGDGSYERSWGGVIMVWVGSQTGLRLPFVAEPVLSVFTTSGVDFARRAGVRPTPLYSIAVGGHHRTGELCARLRELAPAEVVDGAKTSRRRASASLVRTGT